MPINRENRMVHEAVNALLLVWDTETTRLVQHALREEAQEGGLSASSRARLEEADELLSFMEIRRLQEQQDWRKQGIKAYWEQGVAGTDNGGKPQLKVVTDDD